MASPIAKFKISKDALAYLFLILITSFEAWWAVQSVFKKTISSSPEDYFFTAVLWGSCWAVCTITAGVGFYFGKKKDGIAFGVFCYIVISFVVAFLCAMYMAFRYLG